MTGTQQLMLLVTSQSLSGKRPAGLEGSFHLPGGGEKTAASANTGQEEK